MTERRRVPIAAIAGGLFCLVLVFLALQARAGKDPAIGAGTQAAAQVPARPVRKVLIKRVIVRRIIELPPKPAKRVVVAAAPAATYQAPAYQPPAYQPAASAPARAAAPPPAPAPAPAPVVSRGS